jgi:prepilin peptidase CpaA
VSPGALGALHLYLVAALLLSAAAAISDSRTGEIPNRLSLGGLGGALMLHFVVGSVRGGVGLGFREFLWALGGVPACAFIPFLFWRRGAFGGGDVKLLAALGALLLPLMGIEAEFYSLITAAILAPARLAWDGKLFKVLWNALTLMVNPLLPKARRRQVAPEAMTSVRFGPAMFAGTALAALLHWRH